MWMKSHLNAFKKNQKKKKKQSPGLHLSTPSPRKFPGSTHYFMKLLIA